MSRHVLDLGTTTAALVVRRNPRARRVSLRIATAGDEVVVVLPGRARAEDALAIATAHATWIRERLAAVPRRVPLVDGAVLPVHGRLLRVLHDEAARPGVRLDGDELRVGGKGEPGARLEAWLRREARRIIEGAIAEPARRLGRSPSGIVIRDTRSRWGSCSASGALSFSWRLVLAPPEVLSYVIVHEIAHLVHRGHGPEFWRTVGELAGDVSQARKWLRSHGQSLFRYG